MLARDDFVFRSLGVLEGGGLLRPRLVYEVVGRRRTRFVAEAPLVGRRLERRGLLLQWRRALGGHGQVALVCGERGLGKSRLVEELRRCAGRGSLCWVHQCRPGDGGRALRPLAECGERLRRMRGCHVGLPSLWRAVVACAEAEAPSRQLLLRLLDAAGRCGRGVLFALEDAEHLDDASWRVLAGLVPLLLRRRVLVVVTFAGEFSPPWLSQEHVRLYRLRRLSHVAAVRLARSAGVGGRRAGVVAALGDGVPLFVIEQGLHGRAAAARQARARPPPRWLVDFFTAMLDRQGEAAATARAAAVIGVEFSAELLAAICGGGRPRLHRHLRQLTAAGLLIRCGRRYRFAYRLLHRTAWQMLTERARTGLRRKLATARRRAR
ncbi:MAG: AAA family ATPase [Gammaproteobacteria bacterium]|nr:AAA family ATPase [Gammaproteobacteria bacterium]